MRLLRSLRSLAMTENIFMKNKMLIGFIIAVIVVGAGSFYGGMQYGKSQAAGARNSALSQRQGFGANGASGANGGAQARGGNRAAGSGFVNGSIIAQDDKSITVKSADGGSKIVFLSDKTQIMKSVNGSVGDLSVGQNVMVSGSANTDGSITAQAVQIRPATPAGGPVRPGAATSTPQ